MSYNHEQRIQNLEAQLARLMSYEAQYVKYGVVSATAAVTLTTAYQDMTGLTFTFTPLVAENVYLFAYYTVDQDLGTAACNAADALRMQLLLDGNVQNFGSQVDIAYRATGGTGSQSVPGWAIINSGVTANTSHTIKAQVKNTTGARGQASSRSYFYYIRMAQ